MNDVQTGQQDSTYLYLATFDTPSTILKVRKSDLSIVQTLPLDHGQYYVQASAITPNKKFTFFSTHTMPSQILRIQNADMNASKYSIRVETGSDMKTVLAMELDRQAFYLGTFSTPAYAMRVPFTSYATGEFAMPADSNDLSLGAGNDWVTLSTSDSDYVYQCTSNTPARLFKIRKELPMAVISSYTMPTHYGIPQVILERGDYLYIGTASTPATILKVSKADMTVAPGNAVHMRPGEDVVQCATMDQMHLYLGLNPYGKPGVIIKLNYGDMTRVGEVTLNEDEARPFAMLQDQTWLYVVLRLRPSRVVKVGKAMVTACQVSEWSSWGNCPVTCGSSLQLMTRTILMNPRTNAWATGAPCPGLNATRVCNDNLCPVDCMVNHWGAYGTCAGATGQQLRSRQITVDVAGGGVVCPLLSQSTACKVSCKVGEWALWGECEKISGTRRRSRHVKVAPLNGGQRCPALSAIQQCNVDCEVTAWSPFGLCEVSNGQMMRLRKVKYMTQHAGQECPMLEEFKACAVHCDAGPWGRYTACNATSGRATRTRAVLTSDSSDAKVPCETIESVKCATSCIVSDYASWSECDLATGLRTRERIVVTAAQNGGNVCPKRIDNKPCSVDCIVSGWSGWDNCNRATAVQSRVREVLQTMKNGGVPCPAILDTLECTLDCVLSVFGEWSDCSKDCGAGEQSKHREVVVEPMSTGEQCEALSDYRPCNTPACRDEDCRMSSWSQWSNCTVLCGGGTMDRTRTITREAKTGGIACSATAQQNTCNQDSCTKDCVVSEWGAWSGCNSETGKKRRVRTVIQASAHGGLTCPSLEGEEDCPVSCQVSDWGEWTECNMGSMMAYRTVTAPMMNNGDQCPLLVRFKDCGQVCTDVSQWSGFGPCEASGANGGFRIRTRLSLNELDVSSCALEQKAPCAVNCVLSAWSGWGPCNNQTAQMMRTREIEVQPKNGGLSCAVTDELKNCVLECTVGDWGGWSACNQSLGMQFSHRTVLIQERNGGRPCPVLTNTTACTVDCVMADWSEWGDCNMATGVKRRSRNVLVAPKNGGGLCPDQEQFDDCGQGCTTSAWGPFGDCGAETPGYKVRLRQVDVIIDATLPCRLKEEIMCMQQCQVTAWSEYGLCIQDTGRKTRTRSVLQEPLNGAAACPALAEAEQCVFDCSLGAWSDFSACNKTLGRKSRNRPVYVQPTQWGETCPTGCNAGADFCEEGTMCKVDCLVNEWGSYSSCSEAGTQGRSRQVIFQARDGGTPCPLSLQQYLYCPVDCQTGPWRNYSACVQVGEHAGIANRTRPVLVTMKNGGQDCETLERRTCAVDCVMGPWQPWAATCWHLLRNRSRAVLVPPLNNGSACPHRFETMNCSVVVPTNSPTPTPTAAPSRFPTPAAPTPLVAGAPTPWPTRPPTRPGETYPPTPVTPAPTKAPTKAAVPTHAPTGAPTFSDVPLDFSYEVDFDIGITGVTIENMDVRVGAERTTTAESTLQGYFMEQFKLDSGQVRLVLVAGDMPPSIRVAVSLKAGLNKVRAQQLQLYMAQPGTVQEIRERLARAIQPLALANETVAIVAELVGKQQVTATQTTTPPTVGDDGKVYSRQLGLSVSISCFDIVTFDRDAQTSFLVALASELGVNDTMSYGAVTLRTMSEAESILTLGVVVQCGANCQDVAFRLQVMAQDPAGFRYQFRRAMKALADAGVQASVTAAKCGRTPITTDATGVTTTTIGAGGAVGGGRPGGETGNGAGTDEHDWGDTKPQEEEVAKVEQSASVKMLFMGLGLAFVMMTIVGVAMLLRYRKNTMERNAFFSRLDESAREPLKKKGKKGGGDDEGGDGGEGEGGDEWGMDDFSHTMSAAPAAPAPQPSNSIDDPAEDQSRMDASGMDASRMDASGMDASAAGAGAKEKKEKRAGKARTRDGERDGKGKKVRARDRDASRMASASRAYESRDASRDADASRDLSVDHPVRNLRRVSRSIAGSTPEHAPGYQAQAGGDAGAGADGSIRRLRRESRAVNMDNSIDGGDRSMDLDASADLSPRGPARAAPVRSLRRTSRNLEAASALGHLPEFLDDEEEDNRI
jgi:hypothetical protein